MPDQTTDDLQRAIAQRAAQAVSIGLPTMKLNTPASLPGVGVPTPNAQATPPPASAASAAPEPKPAPYAMPVQHAQTPPQLQTGNEPMPKVLSPLEGQINQNLNERQDMIAKGPGWQQIHNPFLRTIARIGDVAEGIALPQYAALTPGTSLHHQVVLGQNARQLQGLEGAQRQEAETGLEQAQGKEAEAKASAIANPPPKEPTNEVELFQQNPDAAKAFMSAQAESRPEAKGTVVETPQGPGMLAPGKTDATPITLGGQPIAGKPAKTKEELQQEIATAFEKGDKAKVATLQQELQALDPNAAEHLRISVENAGAGAANRNTGRADRSFQYNNSALDKVATPIEQTTQRLGRLQDTLAQQSPQADALVAPELLTVMAGGAGSGLRMNEAEISRIVGGRSAWENLRASIQHWATNPAEARSITPEQDKQIRSLVAAVQQKLTAKSAAIDAAREALIDSEDPKEHRRIVADTKKKLDQIDAGGGASGTTHFTEGADHWDIPADKVDAFKKSHPKAQGQ